MKILKNKRNLITLLEYKKKVKSDLEKQLILSIIDKFSRDFNIWNLLKESEGCQFIESLSLDLEKN